MVIFLVYYPFYEPPDISKGKRDLLWASLAKMIELFHFVLPAGMVHSHRTSGKDTPYVHHKAQHLLQCFKL